VQIAPRRPEWYHLDNGFSSNSTMERLHTPVVQLVAERLQGNGDVIDLGCGNGALLLRLCAQNDEIVPYGIDRKPELIERARRLHPRFSTNFTVGDIFDGEWDHNRHYALALLMLGRLLEVDSERARRLLNLLRDRCEHVCVYVYPGSTCGTLEQIARRVGVKIRDEHGGVAALLV
jgi:SAM-dependent methyltransferase